MEPTAVEWGCLLGSGTPYAVFGWDSVAAVPLSERIVPLGGH